MTAKRRKILAYWFSDNGSVTNASGTHKFEVGQSYHVGCAIVPCETGLHGSEHPSDALLYARGAWLDRVELSGTVVPHSDPTDKYAASQRKHLARIDATQLLLDHARWCALQVIHLWNPPDVVLEFLRTGDEKLRAAAGAAARDAALDAAREAAWSAAWSAARDAALDAAREAAWYAAWSAARDAARAAQRADLLARVEAAFGESPK